MPLININKLFKLCLLFCSGYCLLAATPPPNNAGKGILSPQEFKEQVAKQTKENLQKSLSDYQNFDEEYNFKPTIDTPDDTASTNIGSGTPTPNPPPANNNSINQPTNPDNNVANDSTTDDSENTTTPESNSTYYFQPQKNPNNNTSPQQKPSGFNPYGIQKKE